MMRKEIKKNNTNSSISNKGDINTDPGDNF